MGAPVVVEGGPQAVWTPQLSQPLCPETWTIPLLPFRVVSENHPSPTGSSYHGSRVDGASLATDGTAGGRTAERSSGQLGMRIGRSRKARSSRFSDDILGMTKRSPR